MSRLHVYCEKSKSSGTKDPKPNSFLSVITIHHVSIWSPMGDMGRSVFLTWMPDRSWVRQSWSWNDISPDIISLCLGLQMEGTSHSARPKQMISHKLRRMRMISPCTYAKAYANDILASKAKSQWDACFYGTLTLMRLGIWNSCFQIWANVRSLD